MTDETAKKCETALRQTEWSTCKSLGGQLAYSCPACDRQAGRVHHDECVIGLALKALREEMRVHPADKPPPDTPEQKALVLRNSLVECDTGMRPCKWRSGSIAKLATLIASHERLLEALRETPSDFEDWWTQYSVPAINNAWKPDDAK